VTFCQLDADVLDGECLLYTVTCMCSCCCVVGVTEWLPKWKLNGWKLSNGGSVINREELEMLEDSSSGLTVTYVSITKNKR